MEGWMDRSIVRMERDRDTQREREIIGGSYSEGAGEDLTLNVVFLLGW